MSPTWPTCVHCRSWSTFVRIQTASWIWPESLGTPLSTSTTPSLTALRNLLMAVATAAAAAASSSSCWTVGYTEPGLGFHAPSVRSAICWMTW